MKGSPAERHAGDPQIRLLGPGDEGRLEAFLAEHADSSLVLRSNLARGGLADRGQESPRAPTPPRSRTIASSAWRPITGTAC
jgi:hypothetical protein